MRCAVGLHSPPTALNKDNCCIATVPERQKLCPDKPALGGSLYCCWTHSSVNSIYSIKIGMCFFVEMPRATLVALHNSNPRPAPINERMPFGLPRRIKQCQ
jgi:hypothetical protein